MGRKLNLVQVPAIPSSDVSVGDLAAQKLVVETGNKRTLFFVFKSDNMSDEQIYRISERLKMLIHPDEDTKAVVLNMSPADSFEIYELET